MIWKILHCVLRGFMDYKQKLMLMKYLNLDGEVGKFLCGDLFQELHEIIPLDKCFSKENLDPAIRLQNKSELLDIIKQFLKGNKQYRDMVSMYFESYKDIDVYEHLLMGYVFYFSLTNEKYKEIDIFKNAISVLYSNAPSIADIICV